MIMSRSLAPRVRSLRSHFIHVIPLALLPYLASCAAGDATTSSFNERERVAEAKAALEVDLTPTSSADVSDLRNIVGEWTIDNVHDNDLSTKMYFGNHKDDWIQYRLSVPAVVTRYDIAATNYPKRVPSAWRFEASNDGIAWTVLDAQTGQTPGTEIPSGAKH